MRLKAYIWIVISDPNIVNQNANVQLIQFIEHRLIFGGLDVICKIKGDSSHFNLQMSSIIAEWRGYSKISQSHRFIQCAMPIDCTFMKSRDIMTLVNVE